MIKVGLFSYQGAAHNSLSLYLSLCTAGFRSGCGHKWQLNIGWCEQKWAPMEWGWRNQSSDQKKNPKTWFIMWSNLLGIERMGVGWGGKAGGCWPPPVAVLLARVSSSPSRYIYFHPMPLLHVPLSLSWSTPSFTCSRNPSRVPCSRVPTPFVSRRSCFDACRSCCRTHGGGVPGGDPELDISDLC